MFDHLSQRLEGILRRLRGQGVLNEKNIQDALREVRLALLEADVHFRVAKEFVERVRQRAVGQQVLESLTPGQQVVKVVHDELTALMGGEAQPLHLSSHPPTILLLVGLQGSGKTTTAGKLARLLLQDGRHPYLVSLDLRRPAAREQLATLGRDLGVPYFEGEDPSGDPVELGRGAVADALDLKCDVVLVDTAGRLHVDEELMQELRDLVEALRPHEVLFVADAMTGQDAVTVAEHFKRAIRIDGIILTKADGDARGGAALSLRSVLEVPIKFVGTGEKLEALEPFHPDRMASRILGMGDVLSLVERAQAAYTRDEALELERKVFEESFTLEDFRQQLNQFRKMGPLEEIVGMIPGLRSLRNLQIDERELVRIEAIINSMTPPERRKPSILNGSRRRRIARGSGTTVTDVNRLLKLFQQTRKMMKMITRQGSKGRAKLPKGLFLPPGAAV